MHKLPVKYPTIFGNESEWNENLASYKIKIKKFLKVLKKMNYRKAVSMEVLAQKNKNLVNLEKNIKIIND